MIPHSIELFVAGLWVLVWHWGFGIGVIVCLIAAAWFLPVWRKEFSYSAVVVAAVLVGYTVGIHDEKTHRDAQAAIVQKQVDQAVEQSTGKRDPWDDPRN